MKNYVQNFSLYCFGLLAIMACNGSKPEAPKDNTQNPQSAPVLKIVDSLSVFERFIPSGWMGDGEDPRRRWVDLDEACKIRPHSGSTCIKATYKRGGNKGFAAIGWQNLPDNWCKSPGNDYSSKGFTQITFWARGEEGGETVNFSAGSEPCKNGGTYFDSFQTPPMKIALDKEWKSYSIDLTGRDLKSVIHGFVWSAPEPTSKIVFYLDDVYFR